MLKKIGALAFVALLSGGVTYSYLIMDRSTDQMTSKKSGSQNENAENNGVKEKADQCSFHLQSIVPALTVSQKDQLSNFYQNKHKPPVLLALVHEKCSHCIRWKEDVLRGYNGTCSQSLYHKALGLNVPLPQIQIIEMTEHERWFERVNVYSTPSFIINGRLISWDSKDPDPISQIHEAHQKIKGYADVSRFYEKLARAVSQYAEAVDLSKEKKQSP